NPNATVDLQIGLSPDEGTDVYGVVGRREPGQLSEIELLVERRREATVVRAPRGCHVALRTCRKTREGAVEDVYVVRSEYFARTLEVGKKRQLARDDRAADVPAIIFVAEVGLLAGTRGVVQMSWPVIVIFADEALGLPLPEDLAMELLAAGLCDRGDHGRA